MIKIFVLISCILFSCCNSCSVSKETESTLVTVSSTTDTIHIDNYELSPLGYACYQGDLKKVKHLISQGVNRKECMTDNVFVFDAIFASVYFNKPVLVDYFLELGDSVNSIYDDAGTTLLVVACKNSSTLIATKLVENGANVNGALLFIENQYYPLIEAVNNNNTAIVKLLIEHGANIDVTDSEGYSPFSIATSYNNEEMLGILERGKY